MVSSTHGHSVSPSKLYRLNSALIWWMVFFNSWKVVRSKQPFALLGGGGCGDYLCYMFSSMLYTKNASNYCSRNIKEERQNLGSSYPINVQCASFRVLQTILGNNKYEMAVMVIGQASPLLRQKPGSSQSSWVVLKLSFGHSHFKEMAMVIDWHSSLVNDHSYFRVTMAMMNGAVMGKQAQQPPPPPKPGGIEDLAQVTKEFTF